MKLIVKKGRTSLLVRIFIGNNSVTTGAGLTGLTSASSGLVCYRARDDDGNAAANQVTLSAGTRGTWSSGGFVEKDATNMPGAYELGIDNAGLVTGSETVTYMLKGAANMASLVLEIQLVAYDPQSTGLGLTNVSANVAQWNGTNVSVPATAGIPDVNTKNYANATAAVDANNLPKVDVEDWKGGVVPAVTVTGVPKVDVQDIAGVAVSTTTAQLGVNVVQYNSQVATTDSNNLPKVDVEAVNASTSAASTLKGGLNTVATGTATSGASTISIPTSAFSPSGSVSGQFIGRTLIFADNTSTTALQGQATTITASTGSATPTLTVNSLTTAPANGDTFFIF